MFSPFQPTSRITSPIFGSLQMFWSRSQEKRIVSFSMHHFASTLTVARTTVAFFNEHEPNIIFGGAWTRYLTRIYNLRISFPDREILLFDDDIVSAFQQIKYHPNVLSSKGFCDHKYLFIQTGLTFGDNSSPLEFEPFAGIRTALGTNLNAKGQDIVPE